MNNFAEAVKSSGPVVTEYKNYTRDEQIDLFGYVTARDLTVEEVKTLEKYPCVLSKTVSEFTKSKKKQIVTRWQLKVYVTKRLIITISLQEDQFLNIASFYGCDTDNYSEFQFNIPVRLFTGRSRKDNRPYYQYEVFLASGLSGNWYKRDYFNMESSIAIEMNSELMKKFFVKKSEDDESSETVDEK